MMDHAACTTRYHGGYTPPVHSLPSTLVGIHLPYIAPPTTPGYTMVYIRSLVSTTANDGCRWWDVEEALGSVPEVYPG